MARAIQGDDNMRILFAAHAAAALVARADGVERSLMAVAKQAWSLSDAMVLLAKDHLGEGDVS